MRYLSHSWFLMLKDLKVFSRDRIALFFWIAFPFMFIVVFNVLLSDVGGEDERLVLHVATQEAEPGLSLRIIGALETVDESELEPGEPVIVWERDYAAVRLAVEEGEHEGFVGFPADFTAGVLAGVPRSLQPHP